MQCEFKCTNINPPMQDKYTNTITPIQCKYIYTKGSTQKKITGLFGNFSQHGGGGLPNSQNPKPKKSAPKSP